MIKKRLRTKNRAIKWLSKMMGAGLLALFLLFSGFTAGSAFAFSGEGLGTPLDPYQVTTIEQLDEIRDHLSSYFILTRHLDFEEDDSYNNPGNKNDFIAGAGWTPIDHFQGSFDGDGHIIKNLFINTTSTIVGFFGDVEYSNTIVVENIGFVDAFISTTDSHAGIIFGSIYPEEAGDNQVFLKNCFVTGDVSSNNASVGGLFGFGYVWDAWGGFTFFNVENCYSGASLFSDYSNVGGLIGYFYGRGLGAAYLKNSYSFGWVDGIDGNKGGLIGRLRGYFEDTARVDDAFWDTEASDQDDAFGVISENNPGDVVIDNVEGFLTSEMTGSVTSTMFDAFDFDEVWFEVKKGVEINGIAPDGDGYPILRGLSVEKQLEAQELYEPPVYPPGLRVWGKTPASGTTIVDLTNKFTIGWENFELGTTWDLIGVGFYERHTGIGTDVLDFYPATESGEIVFDFADFGFTGSGIFDLAAAHCSSELNACRAPPYWPNILYPPYWIEIADPELPPFYEMPEFIDWYDGKIIQFATPTAVFVGVAGFFQPIFSAIGGFGEATTGFLDSGEALVLGQGFGKHIPIYRHYIEGIEVFFGGFPIIRIFTIALLLMLTIFVFRLILKFIPGLG